MPGPPLISGEIKRVLDEFNKVGFKIYLQAIPRNFTQRIEVVMEHDDRLGHHKWQYMREYDDGLVAKEGIEFLSEEVLMLCYGMLVTIPEEHIGKYALTRFWADIHLRQQTKLLFNPHVAVPGWVHDKYRGMHPKEGSIKHLVGMNYEVDSTMTVFPAPVRTSKNIVKAMPAKTVEEIIVATKKKIKIVKPAPLPIDPGKVKKQKCFIHQIDMKFDPLKQKWRCTEDGCKVTARPVRDEDDRSVQIGKGTTSLRIVATGEGEEIKALLISDDNLALDITPMINVADFVKRAGLLELSETSAESGTENFVDTTEKQLTLSLKIGVVGASDLLLYFDA